MSTETANPTPAAGATEQQTSPEVLASAAEGRRLYIGNLAYATTEGELKDFFKDYLVETVSIPTNPRTTRPVGYAFVDLSTPSEAERAIASLNSQNILDRKVSIQLARKPEASAEGAGSGGEGGSGNETRRRASGRGRGRGEGRARGRGGRAARGGRATNGDATDATSTEAPTNVPGQVDPLTETTNKPNTKKETAVKSEDATDSKPKEPREPREPRERKQRGPPEDGVASKTKVMVANLPYDLREEKLMEIFKDYSPSSAKIALRPIPRFMVKKLQARGEPRKGRGFGFVTLASEELQQKACAEMNGKEIEGREIAVKVAIDSPGKEDEEPSTPVEGEAAAEVKTEEVAA
ncbi:RNA-binding domain-containing protein [Venturia nashicola]|uniref:RNA-binding domain-containing protein n=1 Tax=Venturia nashicola TaxID=86259 RepID=A0A4Z1NWF1_9PEZI|nr:RNA-binding domain-containing protein [Venturia nashicola]TLD21801.1 RNA-binding domain-containing protein [Venturia nashicola]